MELRRTDCTATEAEAVLRPLWQRSLGSDHFIPIPGIIDLSTMQLYGEVAPVAGSAHDQFATRPRDEDPLWSIARWLPTLTDDCWCTQLPKLSSYGVGLLPSVQRDLEQMGLTRTEMCRRFSWSILSPGDITWMRAFVSASGVVEIGAGRGYWADQLKWAGVDVVAYEPHLPGRDNHYFDTDETFTLVRVDDHLAVKKHADRTLLIVWPSYGEAWAAEALARYQGDVLIYAGEGAGGCTADDEFFEILERDWEWLSTAPLHMTWWGIHCQLQAFVRKSNRVSLRKP